MALMRPAFATHKCNPRYWCVSLDKLNSLQEEWILGHLEIQRSTLFIIVLSSLWAPAQTVAE